ncbi:MAG: pentapeptide repeat-containing protein [Cyanobacteria bacterium J06607_17]
MPLPWKRNRPPEPSPDEAKRSHTEKIAYELYQTRQLLKRSGDHTTDWEIAQKIVKNPVRKALYCCHRPFIRLEKNTWEPLLAWADNQALLSLLGLVGNISLIIVAATYIGSEKQRRNAEVLNAWQTITSAHGQAGSGGRIQSLEFLNASPGANWRRKFPWVCGSLSFCLWEAESLYGIDLSVDGFNSVVSNSQSELNEDAKVVERDSGVYLRNIRLPGADLRDASLAGADLRGANLAGADLRDANLAGADLRDANLTRTDLRGVSLTGAKLRDANLTGADLDGANLTGAKLEGTNLAGADFGSVNFKETYLVYAQLEGADLNSVNLEKADLRGANLTDADLRGTNLTGAYLGGAQLEGAYLRGTNLTDADLRGTNLTGAYLGGAQLEGAYFGGAYLTGADLVSANLEGVKGLKVEQLSQAKFCDTQLPKSIDLQPDRDCEEIGPPHGNW